MLAIVKEPTHMRLAVAKEKKNRRSIGFVPTMGALHAGHRALLAAARQAHDVAICSIFVNPTQFDDTKDFTAYPNTMAADIRLLEEARCDFLFYPKTTAIYPSKTYLSFDFGRLSSCMEGTHRPGHLSGVALVMSKLLHIIPADAAYFGQKDWQQYLVVRHLVTALFFETAMHVLPTVREPHGLACSSRNERLRPAERRAASFFYETLLLAKERLLRETSPNEITKEVTALFRQKKNIYLEYFAILHRESLTPPSPDELAAQTKALAIFVAGSVGKVRVIDNILLS